MASSRSRTRSCTYPGRSTPVTAISVLLVPSALEAVGEKFRHNSVKAGHALNLNPVPAFAEPVQLSTRQQRCQAHHRLQWTNLKQPALQHQHSRSQPLQFSLFRQPWRPLVKNSYTTRLKLAMRSI